MTNVQFFHSILIGLTTATLISGLMMGAMAMRALATDSHGAGYQQISSGQGQ